MPSLNGATIPGRLISSPTLFQGLVNKSSYRRVPGSARSDRPISWGRPCRAGSRSPRSSPRRSSAGRSRCSCPGGPCRPLTMAVRTPFWISSAVTSWGGFFAMRGRTSGSIEPSLRKNPLPDFLRPRRPASTTCFRVSCLIPMPTRTLYGTSMPTSSISLIGPTGMPKPIMAPSIFSMALPCSR